MAKFKNGGIGRNWVIIDLFSSGCSELYLIVRNGRNGKSCKGLKQENEKTRMAFQKGPDGCRTWTGREGVKAGCGTLLRVLGSKQGLEGGDLDRVMTTQWRDLEAFFSSAVLVRTSHLHVRVSFLPIRMPMCPFLWLTSSHFQQQGVLRVLLKLPQTSCHMAGASSPLFAGLGAYCLPQRAQFLIKYCLRPVPFVSHAATWGCPQICL